MGVAIVLIPLMLLVLLAPLIFLGVAGSLARNFGSSKGSRRVLAGIALALVLAYPTYDLARVIRLHQSCDAYSPNFGPPISATRVPLLLEVEYNRGGMQVPFNLRTATYDRQSFREMSFGREGSFCSADHSRCDSAPESSGMAKQCKENMETCAAIATGRIPYSVRVSLPRTEVGAGWLDPDVSRVSIVEPATGRILRERKDYVTGGFIAIFHGLLNSHPGQLSCGYASAQIGGYRQQARR